MSKKLAKLTPPRFAAVYPRRRLFNKLDSWKDSPALWVTAPAGAGKTTLIASYLQTGKKTVCWFQLDEGDADLANFFHYLALLAGQHSPAELPALTPEYRLGGTQAFARQFFRAFFAGLPEHSVWVLDNYQEAGNASLDEVIAIALQEIPPGVQVMLISREAPPPSMARLLATQQLHVLEQDEIRLTQEETKGICALHL